MVEVHYNPAEALSDADQSMSPDMFAGMMKKLQALRPCMNAIHQGS